jgi:hypothetical protein
MAEYKVKINERTKRGKLFLEFLRDYAKTNDAVSIHFQDKKITSVPNAETKKALIDAETGNTTHFKGWDDFEKDLH